MSIVIRHKETGRRALIKGAFINFTRPECPKHAYFRMPKNTPKCVQAERMNIVKTCRSLPVQMFGKRKGPFLKLAPVPGWEIIDAWEEVYAS